MDFKNTEKKLAKDEDVLRLYKELVPKYALIRSLIKTRLDSGIILK
jgi:hypothetical protein